MKVEVKVRGRSRSGKTYTLKAIESVLRGIGFKNPERRYTMDCEFLIMEHETQEEKEIEVLKEIDRLIDELKETHPVHVWNMHGNSVLAEVQKLVNQALLSKGRAIN